ncbi:unnamed protein product, partial [Gulo gulo]
FHCKTAVYHSCGKPAGGSEESHGNDEDQENEMQTRILGRRMDTMVDISGKTTFPGSIISLLLLSPFSARRFSRPNW